MPMYGELHGAAEQNCAYGEASSHTRKGEKIGRKSGKIGENREKIGGGLGGQRAIGGGMMGNQGENVCGEGGNRATCRVYKKQTFLLRTNTEQTLFTANEH